MKRYHSISSDQFFKSCQEIEKYKLGDPKSFHYLNQSSCYELVGVDDSHDYLATKKAMDIVGISVGEQVSHLLCSFDVFSLPVFFM